MLRPYLRPLESETLGCVPSKLCVNKLCGFSNLRTPSPGEMVSFRSHIYLSAVMSSMITKIALSITKNKEGKDIAQNLLLSSCLVEPFPKELKCLKEI